MISSQSRFDRFYTVGALKTVPFTTNGAAVQQVFEDGVKKGRPSNATANSIFLGLSYGIYKGYSPTRAKIESKKTGGAADGVASVLLENPVSNPDSLVVYKGTGYSGTLMTVTSAGATPTGANDYRLEADNRTITVDDANANTDLFIIYRYSPTIQQARFLYEGGGDKLPGNNGPEVFGQVVVITSGIVYTDMYDATSDWSSITANTPIRGGANGILTLKGTGCVCDTMKVHSLPSVDQPFLGVTLGQSI